MLGPTGLAEAPRSRRSGAGATPTTRRDSGTPPPDRRTDCLRCGVGPSCWIYASDLVYTQEMTKHLVDIDEAALAAAQAELGTGSMKDTVNEALRRAGTARDARVTRALDRLGRRERAPREDAWR